MAITIIFEDANLVLINKPAGLLSIPGREGNEVSLKSMLQAIYGQVFTVHRLDKDTSGVIVFAKDEITHARLSRAFEDREVEKYYTGIVYGILPEKIKTIDAPIAEHPSKRGMMVIHRKGKASVTEYEVQEELGKFSLLRFRIHTGRTHQIRVHMQHIGHPIVCDEIYGDGKPLLLSSIKRNYKLSIKELEERPLLNRLGLHAQQLNFTGNDGKRISVEAPLPKDMRALLQQLRKVKGVK